MKGSEKQENKMYPVYTMCSTRKNVQYKQGWAVQISHIFGRSEDVQCKQGRSSSFDTGELHSKVKF